MGQRLQENNEDIAAAYSEITNLEKQLAQLKRGRYAYPAFFSVAGFGMGMAVNELTKDNLFSISKFGVYAGVSLLSYGIWAIGHWLTNWW